MHLRVFLFRAGPSFLTYLSREAETAVCTLSLRQVLRDSGLARGLYFCRKILLVKDGQMLESGNLLGFGEKCALMSTVPI